MEMPSTLILSVLLADDDMDDRMLFEDAVSEIALNVRLETVKDGEELMKYLLTAPPVLPDVLFLDLNMPFKNGFQCLEEIRKNTTLQDMIVIIYSTTIDPKDVEEAFNKGASLFISKPNSFIKLKLILSRLFTLDLKEHLTSLPREKFVFK